MPQIPVEVEFTAKDKGAEGVFKHLTDQAEKLTERVNHWSEKFAEVVGLAGGLGAAFGFAKMVEETNEHVRAVTRMAAITGLTTEKADALGEVFHLAGMSAEETETAMSRMSLQALRMEDAMMGIAGPGGGAAMMQRTFAHVGVDLRRGIVPAITQMADRAKAGKLHAMDLRLAFRGMSVDSSIKMLEELKRGGESVKETMAEVLHSGTAVTNADKDALRAIQRSKAEMSAAFERISLVVGREIYPVITDLMKAVAERAKGWISSAKEFGRFLHANLHEAIGLALTLGKILLANYTLQKVGLGGFGGVIGSAYKSGGGVMGLGALGAAALLAASALHNLAENTNGTRDMVFDGFNELLSSLSNLFDGIFDDVSSSDLWEFLGNILPAALRGLTDVVTFVTTGVQKFGSFIAIFIDAVTDFFERGSFGGWRGMGEMWTAAAAEIDKEVAARKALRTVAGEKAAAGKADVIQNFPNARFDITQKFEEGFDPDRILTAFTHDLAALGERGVASGFQPAYSGTMSRG